MADIPANQGLRPPDPSGSTPASTPGAPGASVYPLPPQGSGPPPDPSPQNWMDIDPPTQSKVTYTQPEMAVTDSPPKPAEAILPAEATLPLPETEGEGAPIKVTAKPPTDPEAGGVTVPLPGDPAREEYTYNEGDMHHQDAATPLPMRRPQIEMVARVLENTIDRGLAVAARSATLALRSELGEKLLGWAGYYQEEDIVLSRDRAVPVDKEAFNNALSLVVLALEVGFKGHNQPGPSMLPPHQWFCTADIVAAAMVRGALRSHQLRKGASFEFLSEGEREDRLELNPAFETPVTEGEALRAMLKHLSGLLEGNNSLGYDANPEGFYDYIKMCTRADLEALAEADAKAETANWRKEVVAKARYESVHEFLDHFATSLRSKKWADDVTLDRIDDLRNGFAEGLEGIRLQAEKGFIRDSLSTMKHILDSRGWDDPTLFAAAREVESAYNLRYTEAYKSKMAEAEQLVKAEYEALLAQEREVMKLKVEMDVRNWSIGYKAKRTASLQESMNLAVSNDDKIAVYAAAKRLGIPLREEDATRTPKLSQSARKRARKAKSVTGTIAAEDAEDAEEYAAEQRARGKAPAEEQSIFPQGERAPLTGNKCTASGSRSSSVTSDRSSSPQRRRHPQGSEGEEEDDDTTPVASPAPERGRCRMQRPLALPSGAPLRSVRSSANNPSIAMDTREDGGPPCPSEGRLVPAPGPPPAPVAAPVDLATLTFGNNADPNLLALVRLFQTLISPLSEKIQAIDAKVNAHNTGAPVPAQGPNRDPRARPTSRTRSTSRSEAAPSQSPGMSAPSQPPARGEPPPMQQGPIPAQRGRPLPPSYANSARKGLTVTSETIRQHQVLEADGKAQAAVRGRSQTGHPTPGAPHRDRCVTLRRFRRPRVGKGPQRPACPRNRP